MKREAGMKSIIRRGFRICDVNKVNFGRKLMDISLYRRAVTSANYQSAPPKTAAAQITEFRMQKPAARIAEAAHNAAIA